MISAEISILAGIRFASLTCRCLTLFLYNREKVFAGLPIYCVFELLACFETCCF